MDVVGEMGFITGMPQSATLEVEASARLIVIAKAEFDTLLASDEGYTADSSMCCAGGCARAMCNLCAPR